MCYTNEVYNLKMYIHYLKEEYSMSRKIKTYLVVLGGVSLLGIGGLYINHATKIPESTYEHVPTDLAQMYTEDGEEVPTYMADNETYKRIDWTIAPDKTKKTDKLVLRQGEKVYFNNVKWEAGVPIHIGISNGSQEFYSSLNSGYFNEPITVEQDGTYYFYIKNVGYRKITITGEVGVEANH